MKVSVKIKPNSKITKIIENEGCFVIWVKEPAIEDKANKAATVALAEYFKLSKSQVVLIKGTRSRNKIFEVAI